MGTEREYYDGHMINLLDFEQLSLHFEEKHDFTFRNFNGQSYVYILYYIQ